jgi:hypothetical protein
MKSILSALFLAAALTVANAGAPASSSKNPVAPPPPAPACPPLNYSFIEAGYIHHDSGLGTSDGGYIDFIHDIGSNLFVDGTIGLADGDFSYNEYGAGLGYYIPASDKFHLNIRSGWAYSETADVGEHELYIAPGFRAQLTCKLELYGKIYVHVPEESDVNVSYGAGLVYHLCNVSALTVGGAVGEDDNWSAQAGVRFKL